MVNGQQCFGEERKIRGRYKTDSFDEKWLEVPLECVFTCVRQQNTSTTVGRWSRRRCSFQRLVNYVERERERVFSKCFSFLLVIKSDKRLVFFPFFISCVRTGHVNVWIFCSGFLSLWANMVETLESNSQKLFSFKLAFNDRVRERPHSLSPKIINNSKRQCNRVPSIPLLLDW